MLFTKIIYQKHQQAEAEFEKNQIEGFCREITLIYADKKNISQYAA